MSFSNRLLSTCLALIAMFCLAFGFADRAQASDDINVIAIFDAEKILERGSFNAATDLTMLAPEDVVTTKGIEECGNHPNEQEGDYELAITVPTETNIKWRADSLNANSSGNYSVFLNKFVLYNNRDHVISPSSVRFMTAAKFLPKLESTGYGPDTEVHYAGQQDIQDDYWAADVEGIGCQAYTFYFRIIDRDGNTKYSGSWDPYVYGTR
ncbi:MAG: hypothetical protein EBE86_027350 [Hormoscilla sp. GUM202]|nr:hypothetical protein [Hormoscilla sp. GUM202]